MQIFSFFLNQNWIKKLGLAELGWTTWQLPSQYGVWSLVAADQVRFRKMKLKMKATWLKTFAPLALAAANSTATSALFPPPLWSERHRILSALPSHLKAPCVPSSAASSSMRWRTERLQLAGVTARGTNLPWRFQKYTIDNCEQWTRTAGATVWIFFVVCLFFPPHTCAARKPTVTQTESEFKQQDFRTMQRQSRTEQNAESKQPVGGNRWMGSWDLIVYCDLL